MAIWDYPEPDEKEEKDSVYRTEYDPDEAYEAYRLRRDGLED